MKMKAILASLVGLVAASSVEAATITYTLSLNDNGSGVATAGSYAVYATASAGDNAGIVAFQFVLSGQTTTSNQSPRITFSDSNGALEDTTKGFTLLRAAGSSGVATTGSQNTTGTYVPVYGFGQTGGSIATPPPGYDGTSGITRTTYNSPLLVATGLFAVAPTIAPNGATGGTVWLNNSGTTAIAASSAFVTQNLLVPEPTSLALIGLAGAGVLARRRKA